MKKLLLMVATLLFLATTYSSAAEWVSPSNEECTKNGGEVSRDGVCYAKWDDTKLICSTIGASLPTVEDLRGVLDSCGGKFDDYNSHRKDPAFQSCSKEKGFVVSRRYWSSTNGQIEGYAVAVRFENGYEFENKKSKTQSVHCMK